MDPAPLLRHIGSPDPGDLRAVFVAWLRRVPFENITIQLGEAGPLDLDAVAARVLSGRGGYCFEVNGLLAVLLEALGHDVSRRAATVNGVGEVDHLALVVDDHWLVDAGFGTGPVAPVALETFERDGGSWIVRWPDGGMYRLHDGEHALEDFAAAHHRLSTSPSSGFVRTLTVQNALGPFVLRARTLTTPDGVEVLASAAAFGAALERLGVTAAPVDRLWTIAVRQHWRRQVDDLWARFDDIADPVAEMDALAAQLPGPEADAERGGVRDSTGDPSGAVGFYRAALAAGLDSATHRQVTIQLASTVRNLGQHEEAVALLEAEAARVSDELDDALQAFLALAYVSAGRATEATGVALGALAPHLPRYGRSLTAYAADLRGVSPAAD